MPVSPELTEDLTAGTYSLYAEAEERLLQLIARQLAAGFDASGWAQRKLAAVQALRRTAQAVVDDLGKAVSLEVFDESYNRGRRVRATCSTRCAVRGQRRQQ